MLTVDYERLGVRRGERLLDAGAGRGRHAFEAARRGARVVALDSDPAELAEAAELLAAMEVAGEAGAGWATAAGDAARLPFDDAVFDRVIAAEVLEHVPDDTAAMAELVRVLRPGGTLAVTVPRWLPERVCWALSEDYHAPRVEGGHVRVYRRRPLLSALRAAGVRVTGWDHVHALHSPYWWLRCAVGPQRPVEDHPATRLYHRLLVWDLTARPRSTRLVERALDPVLGKSLVVYGRKPEAERPG